MNLISWMVSKLKDDRYPKKKNEYPKTVAEVLDDNMKFRPQVDEAIIRFKKSKPWDGDMKEKLVSLNRDLSNIYGIEPPQLVFVRKFACGCCYFPVGNLIIMEQEKDGRYSVVVFLHEFGHAIGKGERGTCRWSINLFRKHFPKSFAKLVPEGHLLKLKT